MITQIDTNTEEYNQIFDDVFKTIMEKIPEAIIPFINEAFGTHYPPDEPFIQVRNVHHIRSGKIITDSHLLIRKKHYHLECQSTRDGKMVLRMAEYDFSIALEYADKAESCYHINLPQSCVFYVRGRRNTDPMMLNIIFPDNRKSVYSTKSIWLSDYTVDNIIKKGLIFLLPFYIIKYEKSIEKLNSTPAFLEDMLKDYRSIESYLNESLLNKGNEKAYWDITELINRVADYILAGAKAARKGLGDIMGGRVLELESDKLIKQGFERGIEQGNDQLCKLNQKLLELNRVEDILRYSQEPEYKMKLLREFHIVN